MKKHFLTLKKAKEIIAKYSTPLHVYDEKGIVENARELYDAFSWNKGFKEYFAVKATPNPTILRLLKKRLRNGLFFLYRIAYGRSYGL